MPNIVCNEELCIYNKDRQCVADSIMIDGNDLECPPYCDTVSYDHRIGN